MNHHTTRSRAQRRLFALALASGIALQGCTLPDQPQLRGGAVNPACVLICMSKFANTDTGSTSQDAGTTVTFGDRTTP